PSCRDYLRGSCRHRRAHVCLRRHLQCAAADTRGQRRTGFRRFATSRRMTSLCADGGLVLTRWTLVERTRVDSPEARTALSELCGAYYAPVVAFLRRSGREEDAAREQAHEFFAHVLERDPFGGATRERGRFRSYLLGALKHFLAREHERAERLKRGGG